MHRLLIVEDDSDIASALTLLFSNPLISVEVATNGVQAVARARELRPQVILLDVRLPAMDGFEVFFTLRREQSLSAARVIFVSAEAPQGAFLLAKELGAYACLRKPVAVEILLEHVYGALGMAAPPRREAPGRKIGASGRVKAQPEPGLGQPARARESVERPPAGVQLDLASTAIEAPAAPPGGARLRSPGTGD